MRLFNLPAITRYLIILLSLFTILGSTGCSQKFNDVNDTMKLALFGEPDVQVASDEIARIPYASIYAQVDNGPQAFMVLALAEEAKQFSVNKKLNKETNATHQKASSPLQLKWLSADKGMLTTEYGRIVKSLNLPQGNLVASHSKSPDPLRLGLHKPNTPLHWQRTIDWQPGYHFGYQLDSQFNLQGEQIIMLNDKAVTVLHFIESVSVAHLGISYNNEYWIEPNNGKVLKSHQKLAPNLPYVDITLLKPFS